LAIEAKGEECKTGSKMRPTGRRVLGNDACPHDGDARPALFGRYKKAEVNGPPS
jgi:hypothetical protein